jgi:hypothetical protein
MAQKMQPNEQLVQPDKCLGVQTLKIHIVAYG